MMLDYERLTVLEQEVARLGKVQNRLYWVVSWLASAELFKFLGLLIQWVKS